MHSEFNIQNLTKLKLNDDKTIKTLINIKLINNKQWFENEASMNEL